MTSPACPGCTQPMLRRSFARRLGGVVDIDLCFACRAFWFDEFESAQLTPAAVIGLFREMNAPRDMPQGTLAPRCRCPRCGETLKLTQDMQRDNRISYYRCERDHGRFTTFEQFLREKSFVRSLSRPEIYRLRADIAQVRCRGCGAPVSVDRDAQCAYCGAAVSFLDADAARRTLAELDRLTRPNDAKAMNGGQP